MKMRSKALCFVLFVIFVMVSFSVAFANKGDDSGKSVEDMEIGYVIPYEIGWYTYFVQGFELVAEDHGIKTTRLHNQYNPQEELTAVQDLITRDVDVICVTSPTPESAQHVATLANEAEIPIQVTETSIADGPGKAFARLDFDWFTINESMIDALRKDEKGELKIVYIAGMAGSAPVQEMLKGIYAAVDKYDDVELVSMQYGDYKIDKSMNIMQDWLQAGLDFNVAIGACQEITEGIIQAINQSGVDPDSIVVVSSNGGPMDTQNIAEGEIDYCMSYSPGVNGAIYARNVIAYMKGEPYQTLAYGPYVWTNADNYLDIYLTWDVTAAYLPVVDHFVETGEYDSSLMQ